MLLQSISINGSLSTVSATVFLKITVSGGGAMKSALNDLQIRKAKPADKPVKLADGGGLYLYISPAGGKLWRMDYALHGKRRTLSLGQYPVVSLAQARDKRLQAKQLLADGVDPARLVKGDAANSFAAIAREWYQQQITAGAWSDKHADRLWRRIERDLLPQLGQRQIGSLSADDFERVLLGVAARSVDTAHRLKAAVRGTMNYAIRKGLAGSNPVEALRGVLPANRHRHMAAPTDPAEVGGLLRAIDTYSGSPVVAYALRLLPLVFVRPGELRAAEWAEIDTARALWTIPGEKMKMRLPHLVPLSRQALTLVEQLRPITGQGRYLFPGRYGGDKCLSDMALNAALRRMGFDSDEITGHGFRAMARTLLDEQLRCRPDAIEAQLAHAVPDRLGRAYNRTLHLEERTVMMQAWADYLDELKTIGGPG
jgi:integrase